MWRCQKRWFSTWSSLQPGTETICFWHITMAHSDVFPLNSVAGKNQMTQRSKSERVCRRRPILESQWSWRPSWILKKIPKLNMIYMQDFFLSRRHSYKSKQAVSIYWCYLLSFPWRFALMNDRKMLHNWNIIVIYAFYGSKCISIEPRT